MLLQLPRQELTPEQKQVLEDILSREYSHNEYPMAAKGINGLAVADAWLSSNNMYGLLIGGLAKGIWQGESIRELSQHKDVDVIVLPFQNDATPQRFERGIDWWLVSYAKRDELYFSNALGVSLRYGLEIDKSCLRQLKPGVLLPSPYMVTEMQVYEKTYGQDIDFSVIRALRDNLREGYQGKCIPLDLKQKQYTILDEKYVPIKRIEDAVKIIEAN